MTIYVKREEQTASGFQGGRDDIRLEGTKKKILMKVEQGFEITHRWGRTDDKF